MDRPKYKFNEFLAAMESDDFDIIEESWLEWANKFISSIPNVLMTDYHGGDCTKMPAPCPICVYETLLTDYREYYFDEENWRKENL
jgi:hypothetical protein